ncbi:MAG: ABC transporter ATP-binding protein [Actinomycetota bacterium]
MDPFQPTSEAVRGGTLIAIRAEGVSKRFKLFKERNQTLKHTLLRGRRAVYEEFWALKDVTVEVPQGSTYGLIGENGSGKSTLLKCMAKILYPDSGTITVDGSISALLELGAGFHPELSGRENVFLNGAILGLSGNYLKDKFDQIVEFSGIERFIDTPVKNYSSGMFVRLGFSVAINVEPDVLLIDEILAVGDEEFQQKCRDKFDELKNRGSTIIIVSHSMGMVRNLCDHATWLEHGMVRGQGVASDVITAYLDHVNPVAEPAANLGLHNDSIESVNLFDGSGEATARLISGHPATIRIHYRGATSANELGVDICSLEGEKLMGATTSQAPSPMGPFDGRGYVELILSGLPLLPGIYDLKSFSKTESGRGEGPGTRFEVTSTDSPTGALIELKGIWRSSSA